MTVKVWLKELQCLMSPQYLLFLNCIGLKKITSRIITWAVRVVLRVDSCVRGRESESKWTFFHVFVALKFKKTENKQKETRFGPFKNVLSFPNEKN